ncbi:ABC transporter ATP-binding protein [Streptomyces sp. NPDC026673]|uniref:ABC transporter ATP-binding protein n=1 Tax=Streptomyces sp. NPDC026673 TaxID=3155724 RepID=UPI0033E2F9BD
MNAEPVVVLDRVSRGYGGVAAVRDVSLTVGPGEAVAVVGPSGSGKSTMLNLIGTLDRPTSGTVTVAGHEVGRLSDRRLSALRARYIGFVFQQFHLPAGFPIVEAVADGLLYSGVARRERTRRSLAALSRVGLGHRTDHRPHELSGGERQRAAIARAIVGEPPLLLADEPTGNLDTASGTAVMELLGELHTAGTALVLITHDAEVAARLPRRIEFRDGAVVGDRATGAADDAGKGSSTAGFAGRVALARGGDLGHHTATEVPH